MLASDREYAQQSHYRTVRRESSDENAPGFHAVNSVVANEKVQAAQEAPAPAQLQDELTVIAGDLVNTGRCAEAKCSP